MEKEDEVNLYDVPLAALRIPARQIIINELNKRKVLESEAGLPRDWRGLVHLAGLPAPVDDSPTSQILRDWERMPAANLGLLEEYLGQLDRWDIVDDISTFIREDAKDYICQPKSNSSPTTVGIPSGVDNLTLTSDDISRLERGLPLQIYDALLLYADEDMDFAHQMMDHLHHHYRLKLCLKENLVVGVFEHEGLIRLVSERCSHVIIIVTPAFIRSPLNRFIVTFAQAMAIDQRRRIIIPCIYGRDHINLPVEINYLCKLDYNRAELKNYNFWGRLRDAVVTPITPVPSRLSLSICELSCSNRQPQVMASPGTPPQYRSVAIIEDTVKLKPVEDLPKVALEEPTNLLDARTQSFTCSSVSLSQKKHSKSKATELLRKLFPSKKTKKSKKIAVRM